MATADQLESTDRYDKTQPHNPEHQLVSQEIEQFIQSQKFGWTTDNNDCVSWNALTD